jgi:hypothetical protein
MEDNKNTLTENELLEEIALLKRERDFAPKRMGVNRALKADGANTSSIHKEKIGNYRDQMLIKYHKEIEKKKNQRGGEKYSEIDWSYFEQNENVHRKKLEGLGIVPVQFKYSTEGETINTYATLLVAQGIYKHETGKSPSLKNIMAEPFGDGESDAENRNPYLDTGKYSVGGSKEQQCVGGTHTFISNPDDGRGMFYTDKTYPEVDSVWDVPEYRVHGALDSKMKKLFPDIKKCLEHNIAFSVHICEHPKKHMTNITDVKNDLVTQIQNDWVDINGNSILKLFDISIQVNDNEKELIEKKSSDDMFEKETSLTCEVWVHKDNGENVVMFEQKSKIGVIKEFKGGKINFKSLPDGQFSRLDTSTLIGKDYEIYTSQKLKDYIHKGNVKIKVVAGSIPREKRYVLIRNKQIINFVSEILGGPASHPSRNRFTMYIETTADLDEIFNIQHSKEKASLDNSIHISIRAMLVLIDKYFIKEYKGGISDKSPLDKQVDVSIVKHIKSEFPDNLVDINRAVEYGGTVWHPFKSINEGDKFLHSKNEIDGIIQQIKNDIAAETIWKYYKDYYDKKQPSVSEKKAKELAEKEAAAAAAAEAAAAEAEAEAAAAAAEAAAAAAAEAEAAAEAAAAAEAEAAAEAAAAAAEGIQIELHTQEVSSHSRTLTPDLTDKKYFQGLIGISERLNEFAVGNLPDADDTEKKKRPEFAIIQKLMHKIME